MGITISSNPFPVTYEDLGDVEKWALIETLSPSGVASISSTGTLKVYDEYKIIISDLLLAENGYINLSMNSDSGNNYQIFYFDTTTLTYAGSQSSIKLMYGGTLHPINIEIVMNGKTPAVASGCITANIVASGSFNHIQGLGGVWIGGNATQLTSISIVASGTTISSGKVQIFGRNI